MVRKTGRLEAEQTLHNLQRGPRIEVPAVQAHEQAGTVDMIAATVKGFSATAAPRRPVSSVASSSPRVLSW